MPFLLAFPMIWLRVQSITSEQPLSPSGSRVISVLAVLSICGTIAVETPFVLRLAGTSDWQRVKILSLGFGVIIATGAILFSRKGRLTFERTCSIWLTTAYLANAALCLIVYSNAAGPISSRSGWLLTLLIVWPMALELVWMWVESLRKSNDPEVAVHWLGH